MVPSPPRVLTTSMAISPALAPRMPSASRPEVTASSTLMISVDGVPSQLSARVVGPHVEHAAEDADRQLAVAFLGGHRGAGGERVGIERLLLGPARGEPFGTFHVTAKRVQAEQLRDRRAAIFVAAELVL